MERRGGPQVERVGVSGEVDVRLALQAARERLGLGLAQGEVS